MKARVCHNRDATVVMGAGIVNQSFSGGPGMLPEHVAGTGVEGKYIVRRSYKHDAVHHHWRDLQRTGTSWVEHPLRLQSMNVVGVDLVKRTVAAAGVISVVRGPILGWGRNQQPLWLNVQVRPRQRPFRMNCRLLRAACGIVRRTSGLVRTGQVLNIGDDGTNLRFT